MIICPRCGRCYEQSMIAQMHSNLQKDIRHYTDELGIDVKVFDEKTGQDTYYNATVPLKECSCKNETDEEIAKNKVDIEKIRKRMIILREHQKAVPISSFHQIVGRLWRGYGESKEFKHLFLDFYWEVK